ncbi:MAG: hypothetical protein JOZ05_01985 [Acetobacteraceae bacterium]|nr:hypothetical protein [Acetobacteraceae bacterium]
MARDPLTNLIRLRQRALDDAQRQLVACLTTEAHAQALADEAGRAIARETEAASDPSGSDAAVEAFAAWLPGARRKLEQARREVETLQADTARARAGVAACRTALESVETLQKQRQAQVRQARERRFQQELEDRPPSAEKEAP